MTTLNEELTIQSINSSSSEIATDNEESGYMDCKSKNNPVDRYLDSQTKRRPATEEKRLLVETVFSGRKRDIDPRAKEEKNALETKRRKIDEVRGIQKTKNRDIWVNETRPVSIEELCIHKRKLEDLNKEINELVFSRTDNKVLIVSGPSGSGKSTSVKLMANLAMKSKIELLKKQVVGSEISDTFGTSIGSPDDFIVDFNILKDSHSGNSSVTYFGEFLNQCKMLTGFNEKCVVIEELPNIFHKETHVAFQKAITSWLDLNSTFQLPPLIICITEYDIENDLNWSNGTSFTIDNTVKVETVLGYKLMQYENNGWRRVRFNKVAKTFLKKALNRALTLEKIKSNKLIELQIERLSSLGDLRNAINTLEFWFKFQYEGDEPIDYDEDSIDGKETGLDIFHSIGKIIYGTKHEKEEFEDFRKRHNIKINTTQVESDVVTVDNVSSEVMSHLIRFNLCCLENYSLIDPPMCDDLTRLMDILSLSDDMVKRSEGYGNSSVLQNTSFYNCFGLRIYCQSLKRQSQSNQSRSNSHGKKRVIFSRDSKLRKKLHSIQDEISAYQKIRQKRMLSAKTYAHLNQLETVLIDGFYQSSILSSYKYKYQSYLKGQNILKMERIGGKFTNSITADDEFKADNEDENEEDEYGGEQKRASDQVPGAGPDSLDDEYFGVKSLGAADSFEATDGAEDYSGGEIDSDPIEEDSDEEDSGDKLGCGRNEENGDDDFFSDDSAVVNELF
ncbi:hypothetical protein PMKS-002891 [Pichia membranifaciens]|uniref:Checkpoint protein RAD24-like helical bundle domain-containing protein n=1 Tax=Pichia membranifaciens TaxID=4926 RepID=A0A1Q2YIT8_9ASCO|nr:hypothetical protein PMKS-002891 [Pichia membranifaciens]